MRPPPDRRRSSKPPDATPLHLTVDTVGAGGDGVAMQEGVRHFIPLALPGEMVTATPVSRNADGVRCALVRVETASPRRVAPFCPAFGRCGCCAFQHWNRDDLSAWKRERIVSALAHRGFADPPVAVARTCPETTRRRATLALKSGRIGFREAAAHTLAAIDACPVLRPELSRLIAPLRVLLAPLVDEAAISLTWTDSGADLLIRAKSEPGGWEQRQALADFAVCHDLARLAWNAGDGAAPVAVARSPSMRFGGLLVGFPAAAFLQPSAEGEATLRDAVLEGLGDAAQVADLFCGLGTFALPIAGRAERVRAVDADGAAVAALAAAVMAQGLAAWVSVTARDLFRDPLTAAELDGLGAVVFDPPRAGATAQVREIAASGVPLAVAVSCNPASFARDARTLVEGGFTLVSVTPVDQFPLSPHLELVAVFRR